MLIKDVTTLQWTIYGLIALTGFARGFYGPAVFGMVSDIVPRDLYGNAAAWNSAVWQGSAVAGPILGGFVYEPLGAARTYLLSGTLIACSLLCFIAVKSRTVISTKEQVSVFENIREGLRFVFSNQIILGAMAMDLFAVLFGGTVALLPIFCSEVFKSDRTLLARCVRRPQLECFYARRF